MLANIAGERGIAIVLRAWVFVIAIHRHIQTVTGLSVAAIDGTGVIVATILGLVFAIARNGITVITGTGVGIVAGLTGDFAITGCGIAEFDRTQIVVVAIDGAVNACAFNTCVVGAFVSVTAEYGFVETGACGLVATVDRAGIGVFTNHH